MTSNHSDAASETMPPLTAVPASGVAAQKKRLTLLDESLFSYAINAIEEASEEAIYASTYINRTFGRRSVMAV